MRVFLTGGTGSLGTALLSCFKELGWDCTVYSRDEVKQGESRARFGTVKYVLGDVRDYDHLLLSMRGHDIVVHAGAYKQVPAAEVNVTQAIGVNVLGSQNVARAAVHNSVVRVVGVSTDKACEPVNAYGMTKALMERIFQEAQWWGNTDFICVRYGNVLGSRGSVVPLFLRQLKSGYRPEVTLTAPDATRFWMTLSQAVAMVESAMTRPSGGGAVVVRKCRASRMDVLLAAVAKSCNLHDEDYTVKTIGMRPGEKLHENLVSLSESLHAYEYNNNLEVTIFPPNVKMRNANTFTYTSDKAPQLDVDALLGMIEERDFVPA